jgi:hypothetical protein
VIVGLGIVVATIGGSVGATVEGVVKLSTVVDRSDLVCFLGDADTGIGVLYLGAGDNFSITFVTAKGWDAWLGVIAGCSSF